jgi:hypothetical protein
VVIALDMDAMRGIDYRSEKAPITLVQAKSFINKREAMQGYCRVGRFSDKCWRIGFKDTAIIDKEAERKYRTLSLKFLMEMRSKPVTMKTVQVKEITMPTLKTTKTTTYEPKMGSKRM